MKPSPLLFALALAGCARGTLAGIVPRLDLSVSLASARGEGALRERLRFGARLRFERAFVAPADLDELTLLTTPCAPDDAVCLGELAEAEDELAALLAGRP